MKGLIKSMLVYAEQRPTFEMLLSHPLIKPYIDDTQPKDLNVLNNKFAEMQIEEVKG